MVSLIRLAASAFAIALFSSHVHAFMDIPGKLDVSPNGSATYTIPIKVVPGTSGMEPKLALVYNSRSGSGLVGMGWSISGLSAITRCSKTKAQDNIQLGVAYTSDDRFCLDGKKLMLFSGAAYGANGAEYRQEIEDFSRIFSYGGTLGNPGWFRVKTKSGLTMDFGSTTDSNIKSQSNQTLTRVWALKRVQDVSGNFLTVTYNVQGVPVTGGFYPEKIEYTGNTNTGLMPYASVKFEYLPMPDIVPMYQTGSLIENTVLLNKIQTYEVGNLVREYRLAYNKDAIRHRLVSVTECDAKGKCLPSTTMSNSDVTTLPPSNPLIVVVPATTRFEPESKSAPLDVGKSDGRFWVDFNADGKVDYCRAIGGSDHTNQQIRCTLSIGDGGFSTSEITSQTIDTGYAGGRAWVDVTGDGLPDYCRLVGNSDPTYQTIRCLPSTGNGFAETEINSVVTDAGYMDSRYWVDLNGDGRADYCRVIKENGSYKVRCAFSMGTGFPYNTEITSNSIDPGQVAGRAWVDINGDGFPDFCRVVSASGGYKLSCLLVKDKGTGSSEVIFSNESIESGIIDSTDIGKDSGRAWVDVNGDGLPDYCRVTGGSDVLKQVLKCTLSTGKGFGQTIISSELDGGYNEGRAWIDINGDGLTDYCRVRGNSPSYLISCNLSTGNGFLATADWSAPDRGYNEGRDWPDVTGDGLPDFCRIVGPDSSGNYQISCNHFIADLNQLRKITTGLGASSTITYKPLTDPLVYTKDTGVNASSLPTRDLLMPMYVVAKINTPNGVGSTQAVDYTYGGLKTELQGRGLLGFRWMQSSLSDPSLPLDTSLVTRTEFNQAWPFIGMPSKITKTSEKIVSTSPVRIVQSKLLNQVDNTQYNYCYQANEDGRIGCTSNLKQRYFPFVLKSVEQSWDLNGVVMPTVTINSSYDDFGNASVISISSNDGYSKTTTNSFVQSIPDNESMRLGRLYRSTVSSTSP